MRVILKIVLCVILIAAVYFFGGLKVLNYTQNNYSQHVAPIIAGFIAIVTSILALSKDSIYSFITSPKLNVKFLPEDRRDCHRTEIRTQGNRGHLANSHYFRLRVSNSGLKTAENVEVSVEEVKRKEGKNWITDNDYMPLRLFWSHWKACRYELSIPSGTYRHCDLGFILDKDMNGLSSQIDQSYLFWFDFIIRPNTGKTYLLPGEYKIKVVAFGSNASKATHQIRLKWNGGWRETIEDMLKHELEVK